MKGYIYKRRRLATAARMLVKAGERVKPDTLLAELSYKPGPIQRLEASKKLGIAPEMLTSVMCRKENEPINQGDVLAEHVEFNFLSQLLSPIDGTVALWSRLQGYLYLRSEQEWSAEMAPMIFSYGDTYMDKKSFMKDFIPDGEVVVSAGQRLFRSRDIVAPVTCRVTTFSEEEGSIVLTPLLPPHQLPAALEGIVASIPEPGVCDLISYGYRFSGLVGYGDERVGRLRVLPVRGRDLRADDIADNLSDCIVVASNGADMSALRKLAQVQAAGLVLGSIDIEILAEFCQQDPLQFLGRLVPTSYPIMLMQGFEGEMPEDVLTVLCELEGRAALLDASTQLRAGTERPELLIVLAEDIEAQCHRIMTSRTEIDGPERPLQVGDTVAIMRDPCRGKRGTIMEIDHGLRMTEAETRAVHARLQLDEGQGETIWLPLVNCRRTSMAVDS